MILKFRHVGLVTNDLEKMINFYTKVLNFKVKNIFEISSSDFQKGIDIKDAKAKMAHLTYNDFEIEIFEFNHKYNRNNELSYANYPGYRHIAFIVDNIESFYKKLINENVSFISEPITVMEPENVKGYKFVYLKDPEVNIIELNQLP